VEELKPGIAQQPTEDIARILKETLEGLRGRRRRTDQRADERSQKQKEEIIRVLTETSGRVGGADGAAARIGINRTTLLSRMKSASSPATSPEAFHPCLPRDCRFLIVDSFNTQHLNLLCTAANPRI